MNRETATILLAAIVVLITCGFGLCLAPDAVSQAPGDTEQLRIKMLSSPGRFSLAEKQILTDDFQRRMAQKRQACNDLVIGLDAWLDGDFVNAHQYLISASSVPQVRRFADSSLPAGHNLAHIINTCSRDLPDNACEKCSGLGYMDCGTCGGSGWSACPKCRGDGNVETKVRSRSQYTGQVEFTVVSSKCLECDGLGVHRCADCSGKGILSCDLCRHPGQIEKTGQLPTDTVLNILQVIEQARFISSGGLDLFSPQGLTVTPRLSGRSSDFR